MEDNSQLAGLGPVIEPANATSQGDLQVAEPGVGDATHQVDRKEPSVGRRGFLMAGAAAAGGLALAGPFAALSSRVALGKPHSGHRFGYGPLFPTRDQTTGLELLCLPKGFEYVSFGWTGDEMTDGTRTPGMHDGMAAFRDRGRVRLIRNHEQGTGSPFGAPGTVPAWDAKASGGTTTVEFHPVRGEHVETSPSLSGTIRNCAGGPTPWRTWLSCEENTSITSKRHGYVFEVPMYGVSNAQPLIAMGRFNHEGVAIDDDGHVYETEDASPGGVYRFTPRSHRRLAAGGKLEMLKIRGVNRANLRGAVGGGTRYQVEWVPIANPDPDTGTGVRDQGLALGAAEFSRPEGIWYGNGLIYFACTDGGAARAGQIFAYDPCEQTLTCIFESPSLEVLNAPDNICVSPRGGLVLCEDGSRDGQLVHGLSEEGMIFPLVQNNVEIPSDRPVNGISGDYRGMEFAGACFDPGGGSKWLFVNIQTPGITFAITGPWREGIL